MPEPEVNIQTPGAPQGQAAELEKASEQVRASVAAGGLPTKIEVSGRTVEAESPELLLQKLATMKGEGDAYIKRLESQNLELNQRLQAVEGPLRTIQSAFNPQARQETFDNARYWQLAETSPVAASEYALQFSADYQRLKGVANYFENQNLATVFLADNSDFPVGDKRHVDLVLRTVDEMGAPRTPRSLSAAYAYLKNTGQIQPANRGNQPGTIQAPPSNLPSGATLMTDAQMDVAQKIWDAPDDKTTREIAVKAGLFTRPVPR